jgi:hypothetical protein
VCLKRLIHRILKTHRVYGDQLGSKVAFFYAKLYLRILRPNWAALLPDDDRFLRCSGPPSMSSIAKSKSCTRTPRLLPEELASIVTIISLEMSLE